MNLDAATDAEAYVADLQSALITPLDPRMPGLLPAPHGG